VLAISGARTRPSPPAKQGCATSPCTIRVRCPIASSSAIGSNHDREVRHAARRSVFYIDLDISSVTTRSPSVGMSSSRRHPAARPTCAAMTSSPASVAMIASHRRFDHSTLQTIAQGYRNLRPLPLPIRLSHRRQHRHRRHQRKCPAAGRCHASRRPPRSTGQEEGRIGLHLRLGDDADRLAQASGKTTCARIENDGCASPISRSSTTSGKIVSASKRLPLDASLARRDSARRIHPDRGAQRVDHQLASRCARACLDGNPGRLTIAASSPLQFRRSISSTGRTHHPRPIDPPGRAESRRARCSATWTRELAISPQRCGAASVDDLAPAIQPTLLRASRSTSSDRFELVRSIERAGRRGIVMRVTSARFA